MNREQKMRVGQRICEKGFDLCIKGSVVFGLIGLFFAKGRDVCKNNKNNNK
jgi:hypothetical protein